jgi:hypothetical protein
MQTERCLSDFWREDRSDDRVRELTSVLRGADSLIGVMGSGVRAVWSTNGQSETVWVRMMKSKLTETRVFLDYAPLAALKPPFGGQAVDEVIGYAAHEGGHCLWSDKDSKTKVESIMRNRRHPTTRASRPHDDKNRYCPCPVCETLRIDNILEDAYIDYHVGEKWPVLGEYIRWSRQKIAEDRPIDYDVIARDARPARNSIINLWIACSLYDKPLPDKMSAKVKRAMTFLMSKSVDAVKSKSSDYRLNLAVECWEYLSKEFPVSDEPLPRQAPPPKPQPQQPPEGSITEPCEGGGQGDGQQAESEGEAEGKGGGESKESEGKSDAGQEGEGKGKGEDEGEEEAGGTEEAETGEAEEAEAEGAGEGDTGGEGEENKEGETEPEAEGGEPEAEPEPEEGGQDLGNFGGEEKETEGDGEPKEGGEQGGDEQGAPGNLDDFDIRDLGEVPEPVIKEVLNAIAHELEDLSQSVAEVLGRPVGNVDAQTKLADYDGPAADRVREAVEPQIQEMRRVFDRQAQVKSRHIKGLTTGKLDSRSLARVGTGNLRVYKRREVLDTPDLAVGLLLDVSGSMSSNMPIVWATGCVFAEALIRKQGVNFLALTYTGGSGYWSGGISKVQTTRICDRQMGRLCIGNVDQGGGTPSGEAIASLKVLMDRMPERQKVIIHFTDGAPDNAQAVVMAVEAARKAGYAVWAIGTSGLERTLETQYGQGNWETIARIDDLPGKVAELVRKLVASR